MTLSPLTSWPSGKLAFADGRPAHGALAIVSKAGVRTTVYQDALGKRVMPQPIRVQPGGLVPGFVSAPCTVAALWRRPGRAVVQMLVVARQVDERTLVLTHLDPPPMPIHEMMGTWRKLAVPRPEPEPLPASVEEMASTWREVGLVDAGQGIQTSTIGLPELGITISRAPFYLSMRSGVNDPRLVGATSDIFGIAAGANPYAQLGGPNPGEAATLAYDSFADRFCLFKEN